MHPCYTLFVHVGPRASQCNSDVEDLSSNYRRFYPSHGVQSQQALDNSLFHSIFLTVRPPCRTAKTIIHPCYTLFVHVGPRAPQCNCDVEDLSSNYHLPREPFLCHLLVDGTLHLL
eukprot:Gb_13619 [translate_table: standard]